MQWSPVHAHIKQFCIRPADILLMAKCYDNTAKQWWRISAHGVVFVTCISTQCDASVCRCCHSHLVPPRLWRCPSPAPQCPSCTALWPDPCALQTVNKNNTKYTATHNTLWMNTVTVVTKIGSPSSHGNLQSPSLFYGLIREQSFFERYINKQLAHNDVFWTQIN